MRPVNLIYDQAVYGDVIETEYEPSTRSMRTAFSAHEQVCTSFAKKSLEPTIDRNAPIGDVCESASEDEDRDLPPDDETPFDEERSAPEGDLLDASKSSRQSLPAESEVSSVEKHLAHLNTTSKSEVERVAAVEKYLEYLNKTSKPETTTNTIIVQQEDDLVVVENSDSDDSWDLNMFTETRGGSAGNESAGVDKNRLQFEPTSKKGDDTANTECTESVGIENAASVYSWDSLYCGDDQSDAESRSEDKIVGVKYLVAEDKAGSADTGLREEDPSQTQDERCVEDKEEIQMLTEVEIAPNIEQEKAETPQEEISSELANNIVVVGNGSKQDESGTEDDLKQQIENHCVGTSELMAASAEKKSQNAGIARVEERMARHHIEKQVIGKNDFAKFHVSQKPSSLLASALLKISELEKANAEKEAEVKVYNDKLESLEKHTAEQTRILAKEMTVTHKTDSLTIRELQDRLSKALDRCTTEEGKICSLQAKLAVQEEQHARESSMAKKVKKMYDSTKEILQGEERKTIKLQFALTQSEMAEEEATSRLREIEKRLTIAEERAKLEAFRANALRVSLDETEKMLEKESLKAKSYGDTEKSFEALHSNSEIMDRLKKSNAATQKLIDEEKVKIATLEEKKFEKETLLEAHQMTVKNTKESLLQYQELVKSEQANVQKLEELEEKKREKLENEEGKVREIEFALARKSALIELEKMKQRTLDGAITQKNKMVEAEMFKLREYKARCAEKQLLLEKEQDALASIAAVVQQKEELLASEQVAVTALFRTIEEKKEALKKKQVFDNALENRIKKAQELLQSETVLTERVQNLVAARTTVLTQEWS